MRYCMREASLALDGLVGPAQVEWLDRVRDDLESYRGALTWLIDHARPTEASEIGWGLMVFWLMRGHLSEGLQWYERTLGVPSLPPAAESRALVGAAVMWYTQGELGRADAGLARALAVARRTGDMAVVVIGGNLLGHLEPCRSAISTLPATGFLAASECSARWRCRGASGMRWADWRR